jgi:DNA-binding transcriptional MocR family regulator
MVMADWFYKLSTDMARRRDLSGSAKVIFAVILGRIGHNGHAWPGIRRIANDAGVNVKTAMRAVHELSDAGLLQIENRGNGLSFSYRLTVPETGALPKLVRKRSQNGNIIRKIKKQTKKAPAKILFDPEAVIFSGISPDDLSRWQSAYPALDVEGEIGKAAEWLIANPHRRRKDIRRFLVNWLSRGQKWAAERGPKEPEKYSDEWWAAQEPRLEEEFDRPNKIGRYAETPA